MDRLTSCNNKNANFFIGLVGFPLTRPASALQNVTQLGVIKMAQAADGELRYQSAALRAQVGAALRIRACSRRHTWRK
jgi:hypothetical protein